MKFIHCKDHDHHVLTCVACGVELEDEIDRFAKAITGDPSRPLDAIAKVHGLERKANEDDEALVRRIQLVIKGE